MDYEMSSLKITFFLKVNELFHKLCNKPYTLIGHKSSTASWNVWRMRIPVNFLSLHK